MYKPFTVELFHIQEYLKNQFDLSQFLQIPIKRDTVLLQDKSGEQIAFQFQDNAVKQIPIPTMLSRKKAVAYIRSLRSQNKIPELCTFQEVTQWWAKNPNPLTHQQALGLSDELYVHYLTYKLFNDVDVLITVSQKVISEDDLRSIRLWCRNGNFHRCYLGAYGLDGCGEIYKFIWNCGKPDALTYLFYIQDEYYCFMNDIPYTGSMNG